MDKIWEDVISGMYGGTTGTGQLESDWYNEQMTEGAKQVGEIEGFKQAIGGSQFDPSNPQHMAAYNGLSNNTKIQLGASADPAVAAAVEAINAQYPDDFATANAEAFKYLQANGMDWYAMTKNAPTGVVDLDALITQRNADIDAFKTSYEETREPTLQEKMTEQEDWVREKGTEFTDTLKDAAGIEEGALKYYSPQYQKHVAGLDDIAKIAGETFRDETGQIAKDTRNIQGVSFGMNGQQMGSVLPQREIMRQDLLGNLASEGLKGSLMETDQRGNIAKDWLASVLQLPAVQAGNMRAIGQEGWNQQQANPLYSGDLKYMQDIALPTALSLEGMRYGTPSQTTVGSYNPSTLGTIGTAVDTGTSLMNLVNALLARNNNTDTDTTWDDWA